MCCLVHSTDMGYILTLKSFVKVAWKRGKYRSYAVRNNLITEPVDMCLSNLFEQPVNTF